MNPYEKIMSARILSCYNLPEETSSDEIQKGGEGSRGGKVIGHTQSGKPIYDTFIHPAHKDFTKEDHADARKMNADFMRKKDISWEKFQHYSKNFDFHHNKTNN